MPSIYRNLLLGDVENENLLEVAKLIVAKQI